MSTPTTPEGAHPARGLRPVVTRVLDAAFVIALVAMLTLGTVLVLFQVGGLLARAPEFIIDVEARLGPPTYALAAALGVVTLLVSLAHGWKPSE